MADKPVYYTIPVVIPAAVPATANTAVDGTGTLTEIARGSATKIRKADRVGFKFLATTTVTQVKLFLSTDNGTTKRFWKEAAVPAVTVAPGTPGAEGIIALEGFALLSDQYVIYAAPYTAHAFNTFTELFEP